jgi:zinc transporter ZupT
MSFTFILIGLILSVLIGGVVVTYFNATNNGQMIKLTLAFSGGFLLAIIFQHLLPDLYHEGVGKVGMFILIGFLIQLILEYFSGGIEHGHVHIHKGQTLPWALFISLSIHSIIEGLPLGNQYVGLISSHSHAHESLFWGIIFHQIPVSIALMTLLISTRMSIIKSWLFLLLFAFMTPFGALLGLKFSPEQFGLDIHIILAIVVGMFLHISTTIIFETSENHKFNLLKLMSILIGCALAMFLY